MNQRVAALLVLTALTSPATAQDMGEARSAKPYTFVEAYPLANCFLTGKALVAEKAKVVEAGGRTFKVCCEKCVAKIAREPEAHAKKLDEAIVAAQAPGYALAKCPACDKALGDKPQDSILEGILVRFCCSQCSEKGAAKQKTMIEKVVTAAYEKQKADYPAKKCVVSGDDLDPSSTTDVMLATTLVRICCDDCIDDIKKDTAKTLSAVAQARGKTAKPAETGAGKTEKEGKEGKDKQPQAAGSCCDQGAGTGCCESGDKTKTGTKPPPAGK
jgi:hypothetical protein